MEERPVRNIHCSFCRELGHTILNCNSSLLCNFELQCINHILNIDNSTNIELTFRNFLLSTAIQNLQLVKAFAVRYCSATKRDNCSTCINVIILYFMPLIEDRIEQLFILELNSFAGELPLNITIVNITPPDQNILFEPTPNTFYMNRNRINYIHITITTSNTIYNLDEKCDCNICYEEHEIKNFIKLECSHEFCKNCIKNILKTPQICCALCRNQITNFEVKDEIIKKEFVVL
jgi:hypothetical protein